MIRRSLTLLVPGLLLVCCEKPASSNKRAVDSAPARRTARDGDGRPATNWAPPTAEQVGLISSHWSKGWIIENNTIHHINVRQLFGGAEQAGIKIHAAIDTLISNNHIHQCNRGIWLDWMAQGTRVTGNLVHDISPSDGLFLEVNHGPFLIDHNLFLSAVSLSDQSQGGAYADNLFAGKIIVHPELSRETPWHEPHGTKIAGLQNIKGGDSRFCNNIFLASAGFDAYDNSASPNSMAGNIVLKGAMPSRHENSPRLLPDLDPAWKLREENEKWFLEINLNGIGKPTGPLVTSDLLGKTEVSALPFVQPDGSPYQLERDSTGIARSRNNPSPGPFEALPAGKQSIQVWPVIHSP